METEKIATEQFVKCGNKNLRCGFTTGSAATIATVASLKAALFGKFPKYEKIITPKGWAAVAEIEPIFCERDKKGACFVQKDAGDDADSTNGIKIKSEVQIFRNESKKIEVEIFGGRGVGIVTKPGLNQKVGEAAINSVPRKMIFENVQKICAENGFFGKVRVEIGAEDGEKIAERTFNKNLGIVGGISILGTSGVVEPMSEQALKDAISAEISVALAGQTGKKRALVITPGNIGEEFTKKIPKIERLPTVRCANFIGHALEESKNFGATHVFLIGHAGKLVKIAGGIWNTHSHEADCRMEIIAAHASLSSFESLDKSDFSRIMDAVTVDSAFDVLDETNSLNATAKSIIRAAFQKISQKIKGTKCAILMFTSTRGEIARSKNFDFLLNEVFSEDSTIL